MCRHYPAAEHEDEAKKQVEIEAIADKMYLSRQKQKADSLKYKIEKEAESNLNKLTPEELITWYNFYKAKYQQEIKEFRIDHNEGSGSVVKVRFDDIS